MRFLNRKIRSLVTAYTLVEACSALVADSSLPVLFDSSNHLHRDTKYHPEQPERISTCVSALRKCQKSGALPISLLDVAGESSFSQDELDHARAMLVEAHTEELVLNMERRCRTSKQRRIEEGKPGLGFIGYIDDDTFLTTESFDVCLRATAAWIRAVDLALDGPKGASMALTRPPGHHATKRLSNGFCLFNFSAAAALHALQRNPDLKVSILDWDVHYGQGVADIIQNCPRARYVSIHQTPAFPYLGETKKILGEHKNVLTIPILADNTWTCGYQHYFLNVALPFISDDTWKPDLVIVCAGYDALASDELASVSLTAFDFGKMTTTLLARIGRRSSGNENRAAIMFGLEGGYQLKHGAAGGNLADAVLETVKALM